MIANWIRILFRALTRPQVDPEVLLAEARQAAAVRAHQTDPDVIAYTVARTRAAVDRLMWAGIVLGLLYCASSVQQWGAGPDATGQQWWTAWLITAPVEIPLVAILYGEQMVIRHGTRLAGVARAARIGLLLIMLTLNTWGPVTAWLDGPGTVGAIAVHLLVPIAIILATEAVTDLRDALGRAIEHAARSAAARSARRPTSYRAPVPRRHASESDDQDADDGARGGADGPDESDERTPAGVTKREAGIAWTLEHWPHSDAEPPMPAAISAGLLAQGVSVSRGEASRIRTAAKDRRQEVSA